MGKRTLPVLILALSAATFAGQLPNGSYTSWDLKETVTLLNNSPWAQTTTFTRLIGGVGSGMAGEKEIYSTFFTRLLSAKPIREALARVHQIRAGYDKLTGAERKKLDASLQTGLDADMSQWLVLTVTFRSNDIRLEKEVRRFLDKESARTPAWQTVISWNSESSSLTRSIKLTFAAQMPVSGRVVSVRSLVPARLAKWK